MTIFTIAGVKPILYLLVFFGVWNLLKMLEEEKIKSGFLPVVINMGYAIAFFEVARLALATLFLVGEGNDLSSEAFLKLPWYQYQNWLNLAFCPMMTLGMTFFIHRDLSISLPKAFLASCLPFLVLFVLIYFKTT
jgi:hypothetical protein